MKFKKMCAVALACVLIMNCSVLFGKAANIPDDNVAVPFVLGGVNHRISPQAVTILAQNVTLDRGETVTFDCDYLPKSASVDFGVVDEDGKFYAINCTSGSINKSIEITVRGQYSLAIRNNADREITVMGEVHY